MEKNILKIVLLLLSLLCDKSFASMIRLEKAVCTVTDSNVIQLELCDVKPNKQNVPAINLKYRVLHKPVTSAKFNVQYYRNLKNNKMLLLNRTIDVCKFLESYKKYPFFLNFFNEVAQHSNINHTCPFNHDIEVTELALINISLPVPGGRYLLKAYFISNEKPHLLVDYYIKVM